MKKKNKKKKDLTHMPDQYLHKVISFIKSGIRIAGYCLIPFDLTYAVVTLIASEVVGIIEEMV